MEADVCIVGGGIMGLAAAERLTRSPGPRVTIIDRFGIGNERCASNDDGRMFCYANGKRRRFVRMVVESLRLWRELEALSGEALLVPSGLLLLEGKTERWASFLERSLATLREMRIPVEALDEEELRRRFPQFRSPGGILDPGAGVLLARKALDVLCLTLRERGVRFVEGEQAAEVRPGANPEVRTLSGRVFRCDRAVITAGAWSIPLLRRGFPPMVPTRQEVVYLNPSGDRAPYLPPTLPMFAVDNYYGIPAVTEAGVKFGYHGTEIVSDLDAGLELDPGTLEAYRGILSRYLPGLSGAPMTRSKVCFYDMVERRNFVVGPDPDSPNIIYGYGFSGHGFKFAPLIGKLISELVLDLPASLDLAKLSPIRQ